jgi:lysophospholipase L1-like esterase
VANGTIPSFPNVAPALQGQSVGFGTLFSLDGVHPSSLAHRLIADSIASAINQKYGTSLPVPVCGGPVNCPAP